MTEGQVGGIDGAYSSFTTADPEAAVHVDDRFPDSVGWIANNASGTNGCCIGTWTFFVFTQTFDLSGYRPDTAKLDFRWAADDSGEGGDRGTWTPKYSLNGGPLIDGSWPTGYTYDLGNQTVVASGFVPGKNTISFYVEGNGVTDGMALTGTLTALPVPELPTGALLLTGLLLAAGRKGRRIGA